MINVSKAVIKKEGKILLLRRKPTASFFASLWDFPGGKVESGESFSESVLREVKEETALKIKLGSLLLEGIISNNGHKINYNIFSIEHFDGEIILSLDHTEFKWFNKEEMKKLETTPFVRKFIS